VLGRGLADLGPEHACLDACGACDDGVDLDAPHARGLEEDRPLERPERRRVVTRALGGDAEPHAARKLDDRHHVLDGLGRCHGNGSLVDGEIPGPAHVVPARVAGEDELLRKCGRRVQAIGKSRLANRGGYVIGVSLGPLLVQSQLKDAASSGRSRLKPKHRLEQVHPAVVLIEDTVMGPGWGGTAGHKRGNSQNRVAYPFDEVPAIPALPGPPVEDRGSSCAACHAGGRGFESRRSRL
jgi:hypothetical protein